MVRERRAEAPTTAWAAGADEMQAAIGGAGLRFGRRRAATSVARRSGRRPGEPRLVGLLYIAPAFALYGLFVLLPAIDGAWISLFKWDGVSLGQWTGIGNYLDAVADPVVQASFIHAIVLIAFYSILPV